MYKKKSFTIHYLNNLCKQHGGRDAFHFGRAICFGVDFKYQKCFSVITALLSGEREKEKDEGHTTLAGWNAEG